MSWELKERWLAGGVILAGTGMPPPEGWRPWVDGSKVARECLHHGCRTTFYGWTAKEAETRRRLHEVSNHAQ